MTRTVVVTGGSRGIGRGLARAFLERGCNVAICGREPVALQSTVDQLGRNGAAPLVGVVGDVASAEDLDRLFAQAAGKFGRVDIWINNAGAGLPRRALQDQDPEAVLGLLRANLGGALLGSRAALKGMSGQGGGGFIFNMEGFGSNGMTAPGMSVYGASKSAIPYLTRALRDDAKGTGVKIGTISPGIVATDLLLGGYDVAAKDWPKRKRVLNILGDRVETVAPWIAAQVLAAGKDGARIAWLTPGKVAGRFATSAFRRRDIFS